MRCQGNVWYYCKSGINVKWSTYAASWTSNELGCESIPLIIASTTFSLTGTADSLSSSTVRLPKITQPLDCIVGLCTCVCILSATVDIPSRERSVHRPTLSKESAVKAPNAMTCNLSTFTWFLMAYSIALHPPCCVTCFSNFVDKDHNIAHTICWISAEPS